MQTNALEALILESCVQSYFILLKTLIRVKKTQRRMSIMFVLQLRRNSFFVNKCRH